MSNPNQIINFKVLIPLVAEYGVEKESNPHKKKALWEKVAQLYNAAHTGPKQLSYKQLSKSLANGKRTLQKKKIVVA